MEKCLVTGGAGFIGSHIVDLLLNKGFEVVVLDDLSGGFAENVNSRAEFIEGSITNTDLVNNLFEKNKFDYVFHLAAYAAEGLSHFIRKFNYENNLMGSINLINASVKNKVKCFVFTSSIAVYGKNQLPMREDTVPMPEDPYGVSKLAVEQDLRAAHEMFGLNYVIFRPHNVYGERQNIGDKYRNVVGIFMNQIMKNLPLTIFGDGEQKRAFSYIGDVAPIIADSIKNAAATNQIFNIGADIPYTVNILAKEVCLSMGVGEDYPVNHLPPRNEVVNAYSSHEKVQRVFNYKPEFSLHDGIKKQADWAKKTGAKKSKEFDNIEITENLPPSWRK
jgi:UDP-glucose 4-epimerase